MNMYKIGEEQITKGFSPVGRVILGIVAGLFGLVMILMAGATDKPILEYVFGLFCLLIVAACFTKGRVRQFIGSIIALCVLVASTWYLYSMVSEGPPYSLSFAIRDRNETTLGNSLLALCVFGVPSLRYMWRARFGLGKVVEVNREKGEGNVFSL